ncbi:MAG TPA: mandelate racemase/muconate lactonizing enzyme family protein, partial [Candidatus Hydrogenedentes bacterium]|nr:mandelate racemase/muconate lactonizing enzyme family protein [Candidatus Hydrogenedentota bacterium]
EDLLTHRTGLLACLSDGQGEWWLEVGPVTVLGGPDLNDLVRWCGIWADHWFSNLPPWNIRARLRDAGCPGPVMDTIAGTWSLGMRARRTLLQGMRRKVWLTALLELSDGDASDVFRVARRIAESGYRYAKIKTRGCRSESAVDLLRGIRKTLGPFCQVRVDFNASWSPDSVAEVICGALLPEQGLAPVMYLEDPLPPGGQADSALWPVPLALDTRAFLNQLIAPAICSRVQWGVWKPFVSWPVRFQMLQQG